MRVTKAIATQLAVLVGFYMLLGFVVFTFNSGSKLPILRERLGTILWHSSDQNGVYQAAYQDLKAVDHVYCYYPKGTATSRLILVRKDDGNCSNYLGEAIFRESPWVSEQTKYW